jgi:CRP-like cAMP-binding protein
VAERGLLSRNACSPMTAGKLLRLSVESFEVLGAHHPDLARDILFDLARVLSIKLRHANLFISNWIK